MGNAQARIDIVEVSPRDGLQNEAAIVSTADKILLVKRLLAAGARRIEVASFVNPVRVPQMADAEAVPARLCQAMGDAGLAKDPHYADHVARGRNQTQLDQLIAKWTATMTVAELEALMIEHSVPAGMMYRAPEMLEDPHFQARESLIEVESPRWGWFKMQNAFPCLSDTPGAVRTLAPAKVGQDNEAVYRGLLGMDDAEITALEAARVI